MDLFNLFAKIKLDDSEYQSSIQNSKKSAKEYHSDVMKMAAEMRKQGLSQSEAMKNAYAQIDRSLYETSKSTKKAKEATEEFGRETEESVGKSKKHWWQLGEAVDKTESRIKASTIAMGNLLAKAGEKLLDLAVSIPKTGLTYNMQMENYTANFKVLLGDVEEAKAKVEELKTMAAKTPFAMEDLADATQTLLAFGVESGKTTSIMSKLGDISLGNAQRMSSLSNAYGKAAAQGKLTGEVVQMMVDAGFNPLLQIADATGESMENLQKRMSAGAVSVDELDLALRRATSEGGQFYRGMEEASKTLSGQLSTLEDNWNALLGEAMSPVSEQLSSKTLPAAIEALDKLSTALFGVGEDAETAKKKLFIDAEGNEQDPSKNLLTWVSDLMAEWTNGVVEDKATVEQYVTAFNENTNLIKDALWKRINDTSNPMTEEEIEAAKAKIAEIESMQHEVDALLQKRQGGYITQEEEARLRAMLTTLETMQTELEATVGFDENVVSPWERFVGVLGDLSVDAITGLTDGLLWISENGEEVKGLLTGIGIAFGVVWAVTHPLGTALGVVTAAGVALIANWEDIKAKAAEIWNSITSTVTEAWDSIISKIQTAIDKFNEFFGLGTSTSSRVSTDPNRSKSVYTPQEELRPDTSFVGPMPAVDGSHALGLSYVPYDDYIARLHQGEAVLTKMEAQQWRSGNTQHGSIDYERLAAAIVSAFAGSGIGFSVSGHELATATAGANSRAINARQNDINIGRVRF